MSDKGEHWQKWVGYDWAPEPLPEITINGFDDFEPTDAEIEALIEAVEEAGCCCCGERLNDFQDWFEDNADLIEDDLDGLDFTQKLLIKDWLQQAFSAGREE